MDATTRWETEAMRASTAHRTNPPRPSSKRSSGSSPTLPTSGDDRRWVTLKEAEAATQIPSNTIRKWVRKGTVDSYLESDGQMALRMVDLDSLLARAKSLGRAVTEVEIPDELSEVDVESEPAAESSHAAAEAEPDPPPPPPAQPAGTMLVPIDAWNKMLNQLGNLHEAGQQLAEARERAAKAETESVFLRERLADMRQKSADSEAEVAATEPDEDQTVPQSSGPPFKGDGRATASQGDVAGEISDDPDGSGAAPAEAVETTTYWRYLTSGWRDRKRRLRR